MGAAEPWQVAVTTDVCSTPLALLLRPLPQARPCSKPTPSGDRQRLRGQGLMLSDGGKLPFHPASLLHDSCNVPLAATGTKRLRTARRWHLPCCPGASPPRRLQPGRSRGRGSRAAVPGTQRCSARMQRCSTCMQMQRTDAEMQRAGVETQRTGAELQRRDVKCSRGM